MMLAPVNSTPHMALDSACRPDLIAAHVARAPAGHDHEVPGSASELPAWYGQGAVVKDLLL